MKRHPESSLPGDPRSLCWRGATLRNGERRGARLIVANARRGTRSKQETSSQSDCWNKSQLPTRSQPGHAAQTRCRCSDGNSPPAALHSPNWLCETSCNGETGRRRGCDRTSSRAVLLGSPSASVFQLFGTKRDTLVWKQFHIPTLHRRWWCMVEANSLSPDSRDLRNLIYVFLLAWSRNVLKRSDKPSCSVTSKRMLMIFISLQ